MIKDAVDREKLIIALNTYIFSDAMMKENRGSDIAKGLSKIFSDRNYIRRLDTSDKRWIDEEIDVVTKGFLEFVNNI